MRYLVLVTATILLSCNLAADQSPPFSTIRISGKVEGPYDRVSLFASGRSKTPIKTEPVSPVGGQYTIDVSMLNDMRKNDDYRFTDMRFWKDTNGNGIKDPGEPISQCHFIMWFPAKGKVYLQVYDGPRYEIASQAFTYNYK